jgi:HSP20 family protein
MALVRWSPGYVPARDLITMQDELSRFVDGIFTRTPSRSELTPFVPVVDIEETPEAFVLRADLPGVPQKDVKVSLMGDTLTIRGSRSVEKEQKDRNLLRVERRTGQFERSFTLGTPVRADAVKASYRDGVLEIHVPKADEARLKEIDIQVG